MPASSSSLSPLVATIGRAAVPAEELSAAQSIGLLQVVSAVPDPRRRRGRRYSLQSILLIAVSAVLAGARSYAGIADWAVLARPAVGVCGRPPSGATIRRVLLAVDPIAVEAALTAWTLACRDAAATTAGQGSLPRNERRRVLAVDGKNLRGARHRDGQQTRLLAATDHSPPAGAHPDPDRRRQRDRRLHHRPGHSAWAARMPDHRRCAAHPARSRRLPARPRRALPVHGEEQPAHAAPGAGGAAVASRAPRHRTGLAARARPDRVPHGHRPRPGRDRGRGVVPGCGPRHKIVRRRTDTATGVASTETVYAITSLGHRYADAVLLAIWLRGHWRIENTLHWVRDVTFGEDHSAVRTGAGPQVMAALRTAINVSRLAGHSNIAAAQRHYSWTPGAAIDAITAA